MSEEQKQRLKEYQRNYREAKNHLPYIKHQLILKDSYGNIGPFSKLLPQRYFLLALLLIL